jgi:hypothetical protein
MAWRMPMRGPDFKIELAQTRAAARASQTISK